MEQKSQLTLAITTIGDLLLGNKSPEKRMVNL